MALWEVGDDYRCRLAGTAVDGGLGCHLKGLALSDMRCPLLDEARSEFAAVRDGGLVSFAERTLGWVGKPHRYYRHLILPLRDSAGEIGQLLSVLPFHN